ncbi:hypothetical protein AAMO2058_001200400 [Amorphochlora amoebiformis]
MDKKVMSMQMSPQDAAEALRRGGAVLCLGVPDGTIFGIDCASYGVGPKFMGLKMIPPGIHILHFAPTNVKKKASAPKTSLFVTIKEAEVLVYRWDKSLEGLVEVTEEERRQYTTGYRRLDFDAKLAPYPLRLQRVWESLTPHLSPKVRAKLEPIQKFRVVPRQPLPAPKELSEKLNQTEEQKREKSFISTSMASKGPPDARMESKGDEKVVMQLEHKKAKKMETEEGENTVMEKEKKEKKTMNVENTPAVPPPLVVRRRFYSRLPDSLEAIKAAKKRCKALQTEMDSLRNTLNALEVQKILGTCKKSSGKVLDISAKKAGSSDELGKEIKAKKERLTKMDAKMRSILASVTTCHMDKSEGLYALMNKEYPGQSHGVLGELEFAFCSFVFGESFEGLEQWKKLTRLLCSCDKAVDEKPDLFAAFTQVLHSQLHAIPRDFFQDCISKENFLHDCLKDYLEILKNSQISGQHRRDHDKLQSLLKTKFGLVFVFEEDSEDGPVIVELTEKQLAELKLS